MSTTHLAHLALNRSASLGDLACFALKERMDVLLTGEHSHQVGVRFGKRLESVLGTTNVIAVDADVSARPENLHTKIRVLRVVGIEE